MIRAMVMSLWRRASLRVVVAVAIAAIAVHEPMAARQAATPAASWQAEALASFDVAWQTINDSFYDPTFGGVDWAAAKAELRPRVERAPSADAARDVIRELIARLRRSHFALISSSPGGDALPGTAMVPADIRVLDGEVVIISVTAPAGGSAPALRPGDRIVTIDAEPAETWAKAAKGLDPRAAALEIWRRAFRALHGPSQSPATIEVRDPSGRTRRVTVPRVEETGQTVSLGNLPPLHVRVDAREEKSAAGRRVGVIAFNVWMPAVDAPFAAAIDRFRSADGLVIDLRGNPGGLADMIRGISGHLLAEPAVLGRMQMRDVRLEFKANPRLSTPDGRRVQPFAGKVALIVDELTASASECFAGALQSLGRVRVFGRTTMGQALPAATKALPNGDVLLYAVGDFVTSTGQLLEGRGVVPDEAAPLVIGDLAAGRDQALRAALAWVDRPVSAPF